MVDGEAASAGDAMLILTIVAAATDDRNPPEGELPDRLEADSRSREAASSHSGSSDRPIPGASNRQYAARLTSVFPYGWRDCIPSMGASR